MKTGFCVLGILAACLFTIVGCGKSDSSNTSASQGQVIDATKLRPAFATATPEVKAVVDQVMTGIQASIYKDALAGLDKLAANPSLTDEQKNVVASLTDQIKKKMAATASPPGQ
jgi:hypothetical protein